MDKVMARKAIRRLRWSKQVLQERDREVFRDLLTHDHGLLPGWTWSREKQRLVPPV